MKRLFCMLLVLGLIFAGCGAPQTETTTPQLQQADIPTGPMPDLNVIPYAHLRYFLGLLDEQLYANICSVYESAINFQTQCSFHYPMDPVHMSRLITLIRYECPELFQLSLSGSVSYTTVNGMVTGMTLPYAMTRDEYETALAQCNEAVSSLLAQAQGLSDTEKERLVYDFITANCNYDTQTDHAGSIYGCLVEKTAKCDGISLSMKWIMEQLDVSCLLISGEPRTSGVGHAWNLICLDGVYYDLDVTSDVRRTGEDQTPLYAAYNADTALIRDLYVLDEAYSAYGSIPGCPTMEQSFYALEGTYVAAGHSPELETLFLKAYNESSSFTLQFADAADFESFVNSLEDNIASIAQNNNLPGYRWSSITTQEYRCIRVFAQPY